MVCREVVGSRAPHSIVGIRGFIRNVKQAAVDVAVAEGEGVAFREGDDKVADHTRPPASSMYGI